MPLLMVALAQGLEIFLYRKKLWFCYLICDKYFVCHLKLIFLSRVIPSSSTESDDLMVFPSRGIFFHCFVFWKKHKLNFDVLATILLSFSYFIAVFVSNCSLLEMASKSFPQAYTVVLSTNLQISVSFMKRSKSLIKILNWKRFALV